MKSLKENYMIAMEHGMPEQVPIYSKPVRYNVGLGDVFEKGPVGGGKDGFGTVWATDHGAQVPVPGCFVLTDITRWKEQVTFPDIEGIDWEKKAEKEMERCNRAEQVVEYGMGNGPFERILDLMGYEEVLAAFEEEPEACHEYFKAFTEYRLKYLEKIAKYYKPDYVVTFDDCAFDSGPFMTMEQYEEFIQPEHMAINRAIYEIGAKPIQHCCGRAERLLPEFIKEGAVAWSSVQPYNDIVGILQAYGNKITLIGGYNTNGPCAMLDSTDEQMITELHRCMDTYAPYGSYILGNHIVEGKTPEETMRRVLMLREEGLRYGKDFYKTHEIKRQL